MKKIIIPVFLILAVSAAVSIHLLTKDELRSTLETVFQQRNEAERSGDMTKLESTVSTRNFRNMQNFAASIKRPLPELIKGSSGRQRNFSDTTFVESNQVGDTASLTYYYFDNDGDHEEVENAIIILFIKFVREGETWKFDRMAMVPGRLPADTKPTVEFYRSVLAAELGHSIEAAELAIDGIVRDPPALVQEPYAIAHLSTSCRECEIRVRVNDIEQHSTKDTSSTGTLMGGLQKGENRVEVDIRPLNNATKVDSSLTIFRIERQDEWGEPVFEVASDQLSAGNHQFSFTLEE